MPDFDELVFGGGRDVPLKRDGKETGEMFFLAEDAILVSEFDLITTQPMTLPGDDTERMYYICTLKGRKNNERSLSAITIVLTYGGIRALTAGLRTKMVSTPPDYRVLDSREQISGSITEVA